MEMSAHEAKEALKRMDFIITYLQTDEQTI